MAAQISLYATYRTSLNKTFRRKQMRFPMILLILRLAYTFAYSLPNGWLPC